MSRAFDVEIDEIFDLSSLKCHEEEVPQSYWMKITAAVMKLFDCFLKQKPSLKEMSCRSVTRVLIVIFGCLGNNYSSKKLVLCNESLVKMAGDVFRSILESFGAKDLKDLETNFFQSMGSAGNQTVFDLILHECTNRIAHLRPQPGSDPLSKGPLFRDALVWATMNSHYPILRDSQHLNILHPLALQLVEDYRCRIKILGLNLLSHISREVLVASWRSTGRAEVTLEVLTCQRFAHAKNKEFSGIIYCCFDAFIRLLEPTSREAWQNKYMDMLLSDLALAGLLDERLILLNHINELIDLVNIGVMAHLRQLLTAAELTLLAPRAPSHDFELCVKEHKSFQLQLNVIRKLVDRTAERLFPDIVPMVVPLLVAFVDVEWSRERVDQDSPSMTELAKIVSEILTKLSRTTEVRDAITACANMAPNLHLVFRVSQTA